MASGCDRLGQSALAGGSSFSYHSKPGGQCDIELIERTDNVMTTDEGRHRCNYSIPSTHIIKPPWSPALLPSQPPPSPTELIASRCSFLDAEPIAEAVRVIAQPLFLVLVILQSVLYCLHLSKYDENWFFLTSLALPVVIVAWKSFKNADGYRSQRTRRRCQLHSPQVWAAYLYMAFLPQLAVVTSFASAGSKGMTAAYAANGLLPLLFVLCVCSEGKGPCSGREATVVDTPNAGDTAIGLLRVRTIELFCNVLELYAASEAASIALDDIVVAGAAASGGPLAKTGRANEGGASQGAGDCYFFSSFNASSFSPSSLPSSSENWILLLAVFGTAAFTSFRGCFCFCYTNHQRRGSGRSHTLLGDVRRRRIVAFLGNAGQMVASAAGAGTGIFALFARNDYGAGTMASKFALVFVVRAYRHLYRHCSDAISCGCSSDGGGDEAHKVGKGSYRGKRESSYDVQQIPGGVESRRDNGVGRCLPSAPPPPPPLPHLSAAAVAAAALQIHPPAPPPYHYQQQV